MPQPIAPKAVKPSFGSDKAKKQKMALIFGVLIAGIIMLFFVKKRRTVENPIKASQAKAELQANEGAKDAPAPIGMQPGGDALASASPGNDDPFLKQLQEFKKQQQEQEAQLKKAQDDRQQQAILDARKQAEGERQAQGVPPSVGPDGTARTAQGGQGQQVPEKNAAPPYAGYDTTSWILTQSGRVRPAYETGAMYPADPQQHAAMEQRWFNSFASPMVVGLEQDQNASMARIKADTSAVPGSIGGTGQGLVVYGRVPAVRDSQSGQQGDPAHWGGWIKIRPVDEPAAQPAGQAATQPSAK